MGEKSMKKEEEEAKQKVLGDKGIGKNQEEQ